jgi:hypothetical protein
MRLTMVHFATAALLLTVLCFKVPPQPPRAPFMRGMVVSCPRWGPVWGSPAMAESLAQLSALGVDRVAIHPYGWIQADGSIQFRPTRELDFLRRAVELSRSAELPLFWKPHLGYWGTFAHRGAIDFGQRPAAWARFFRDYEDFIVDQARFAADAGVDLFAVGVELEGTVRFEEPWREIIRRVRKIYPGRIVYAANWDRLGEVPFWDAVDFVGVHAYFPLSDEVAPDRQTIARGWDRPLADLERLSRRTGKEVLIAEIGYNVSSDAARTPWTYETVDTEEARDLRLRLIEVAIQRLEGADFVAGMFWWKWMPGSAATRNFSMCADDARRILERQWGPKTPSPPTAR